MDKPKRVCNRCVMDTSAADISFDERGYCRYCTEFLESSDGHSKTHPTRSQASLKGLVANVKKEGKGKRYNCIVGVSGGVDSSWALVQAVRNGLRPLAVHMDNGWDSEEAQNNVANLIRNLGVDLYTHVIDWDEYRGLMQAFFDADVIDVELLYDNAMLAVNYQQAAKHRVKFILSGGNRATEGMLMPSEWNWFKYDKRNIKAIARKLDNRRLRTFPAIGTFGYVVFRFIRGIQWIEFLDHVDYIKSGALLVLQQDYGYKPYGHKHYESIFTRFYQGHILPRKFGVDKRRLHLSNLVVSGEMTRDQALRVLDGSPYASDRMLEDDKKYFIKKMGWKQEDLEGYLKRPERSHLDFPSEKRLWKRSRLLYKALTGRRANS